MIQPKKQILKDADYKYSFDREIYFNKKDKKIFEVLFQRAIR